MATSDVKQETLDKLAKAVLEYNSDESLSIAKESIEKGINPLESIEKGLAVGIKKVGDLFEKQEYALPHVMLAADAMTVAMDFLKSHISKENLPKPVGKMVIGTVEGDIHDIGCQIVTSLFQAAGFEVNFVGNDTPSDKFIDEAEKMGADIIGASALITTTMTEQKVLIKRLENKGVRNNHIVMVGGGPVTEDWAEEIVADGYAPDAISAVEKAKELMKS
jgi:trimethylamine corrinoid protein